MRSAQGGCAELAKLQDLTSLSIGYKNNIGPGGCAELAKLQHLTSLSIDNYRLGALARAAGAEGLQNQTRVRPVRRSEPRSVRLATLQHLADLANL